MLKNNLDKTNHIAEKIKQQGRNFYAWLKAYIRMLLEQEKNFLADTSIVNLSQPKFSAHLILWATFLFVIIAIIWANLAVIDEVTIGEGKVIPSRKIQVVQSLEGGIVGNILTREGDIVNKDQVLMHIDDTQFSSSYREGEHRAVALIAKIARLKAEAEGSVFTVPDNNELKKHPEYIDNERALYESNRRGLESKLTTFKQQIEQQTQELNALKAREQQLQKSYSLIAKELELNKPLLKQGAVSEVEIIRLERQLNDTEGDLTNAKLGIPKAEAGIAEIQSKINELQTSFSAEARDQLNKAEAELGALTQSNRALEDRFNRTAIRSPVKGTIKTLHVATIGGVIKPGMDLIEIVPLDDTLLIEARIRPADIGFIHPGQSVMVKVSAYDFSIYGGLKGKVEQISADSITDEKGNSYYQIYVRTDKNHLGTDQKPLSIIPGMIVTVNVLTGQKTVWDYLIKPILKAKQNALRER